MAFAVSIRSAILAAVILQAVFIGLSVPASTSFGSTTTEPNVDVGYCNQTCNRTHETPCSNSSCFCVTVNNSIMGECYTWSWDGMDDNATLPPNISDAAPQYKNAV
uniref:Basic tail secreted protein n=1 Tax=Rhipicephalus zambeziensis TaxID=60191 RepID=A0A224YCH1_9ACAR